MAGTAKLHFMWGTLLVQTVTIIERCIATMYIKNYEVKTLFLIDFLLCVTFLILFSVIILIVGT